jgi:hypothetical protein
MTSKLPLPEPRRGSKNVAGYRLGAQSCPRASVADQTVLRPFFMAIALKAP